MNAKQLFGNFLSLFLMNKQQNNSLTFFSFFLFFLSFFLLVSLSLIFVSSERFSNVYSPYYLCSGIVDYEFYLPSNQTIEGLNLQAISMMSPSWGFLKAECKSDMKRLICSMIYQPFLVLNSNNPSNSLKLPCQSLCIATTYQGTSCSGMMEAFGTAIDCTITSIFDPSNDPLQCNSMEFTEVPYSILFYSILCYFFIFTLKFILLLSFLL